MALFMVGPCREVAAMSLISTQWQIFCQQGIDQEEGRAGGANSEELRMVAWKMNLEVNLFRFRVYLNGFNIGLVFPQGVSVALRHLSSWCRSSTVDLWSDQNYQLDVLNLG